MSANLEGALSWLHREEGGEATLDDGKGLTSFGQTADWLREYGLIRPTTPAQASANYASVWQQTRILDVIEWDADVGRVMVTFATHAHERTAIKALQRVLGVDADGVIGTQETLPALHKADPRVVLRNLVAEYCVHLGHALANRERDNRQFARNWLGTRLARLIRLIRVAKV